MTEKTKALITEDILAECQLEIGTAGGPELAFTAIMRATGQYWPKLNRGCPRLSTST